MGVATDKRTRVEHAEPSIGALIDRASYLPPEKIELIRTAYEFAAESHSGQTRLTGSYSNGRKIHSNLMLSPACVSLPT